MSEIFSQLSGRQEVATPAQLELGLPDVASAASLPPPPRSHRARQPAVAPAPVDESILKEAQTKLTNAQAALARNEELLASLHRELATESEARQQAQTGFNSLQRDIRTLKDQSIALAAERDQLQQSLAELRAKAQPPPDFQARQEELARQQKDIEGRIRNAHATAEKANRALATEQRLRDEERQQAAARERELNEQLLKAQRSRSRMGIKSMAIAVIAVLAVGACAFLCNRHKAKPAGDAHAAADNIIVAASMPAAPLPSNIEHDHSSISSHAETGGGHPSPAPAVTNGAVLPVIELKGLQAKPVAGGLQIVFDKGVFNRRAILSDEAAGLLKQLAGQLRPAMSTCRLEITGHADSDPVRGDVIPDNQALAYQRARAVAEYLATQGSLPADALSAISAGDTNGPYPNTSPELRRKNRTVTISVIPR